MDLELRRDRFITLLSHLWLSVHGREYARAQGRSRKVKNMDNESRNNVSKAEQENLKKIMHIKGARRKPIVTQFSEGQVFDIERHRDGTYRLSCKNEDYLEYCMPDHLNLAELIRTINKISEILQTRSKFALFQFIQKDIE